MVVPSQKYWRSVLQPIDAEQIMTTTVTNSGRSTNFILHWLASNPTHRQMIQIPYACQGCGNYHRKVVALMPISGSPLGAKHLCWVCRFRETLYGYFGWLWAYTYERAMR